MTSVKISWLVLKLLILTQNPFYKLGGVEFENVSVNQAERVSQKKLLNCIMGSEPDWYNGLNVRITAVCWILTILFYVILSRVLQLYEVQY